MGIAHEVQSSYAEKAQKKRYRLSDSLTLTKPVLIRGLKGGSAAEVEDCAELKSVTLCQAI